MTDFGDWVQNYGLDIARLMVQGAILGAVILYSRKLLQVLRASQEQVGALLRLSLSGGASEQPTPRRAADEFASRPVSAPASTSIPASAFDSSFDSAPAYAPPPPSPAPAQSYSHGSILGPINGFTEREQSLGGRVAPDRATATMVEETPEPEFAPLTPWVGAPMNSPADSAINDRGRVAAAVQWLQSAPAPKKRRGNPIVRAIRWLQAPAGH
jgi:hypothetical protein